MFFDQIELSKKSWHYKLQQLTFGKKMPNYFSFCPYFWLTILCMLASPVTLSIHLILLPFKLIDKYILQPNVENWLMQDIPEDDINTLINGYNQYMYKKTPFTFGSYYKDFYNLHNYLITKRYKLDPNSDDYNTKLNEIRDKLRKEYNERYAQKSKADDEAYKLERERKYIKQEKRKALDAKVSKILSYIIAPFKFIFSHVVKGFKFIKKSINSNGKLNIAKLVKGTKIVISTILILFFSYLAIKGISAMEITSWNWKSFGIGFMFGIVNLGILFSYLYGFMIVGYILISYMTKLIKHLNKHSVTFNLITDSIEKLFSNIGIFFTVVGKLLISPFKLFIIFVKTFKEDNCPALTFKEDNNND